MYLKYVRGVKYCPFGWGGKVMEMGARAAQCLSPCVWEGL